MEGSVPRAFAEVSGTLFFRATIYDNGSYRRELWKSDGTAAGTVLLAPNIPAPAELFGMIWMAVFHDLRGGCRGQVMEK